MHRVVSLFSGCGGLDVGFRDLGFEILYACDSDPAAVDCYARNVGKHVYQRDVRDDAFRNDIAAIGGCDVVLGGFPCQGFSKAGPKRSDDQRNNLYWQMCTTVKRLTPAMFIAENVDGMSQNYRGSYVRRIREDFAALGYHVECRVLNAAAFGLPQHRRRIFFVGHAESSCVEFAWPTPTHNATSRNGESPLTHEFPLFDESPQATLGDGPRKMWPARTIRDAIGDLCDLTSTPADHAVTASWPAQYHSIFQHVGPGQKICNVRNAATSVKTWQIPEVFGPVTEQQVTILDTIARHRRHKRYGRRPNGNPIPRSEIDRLLPDLSDIGSDIATLLKAGYLKEVSDGMFDLKGAMFCSGIFKRPLWDSPSPTVLTNFHNPRYFLHPERHRPFSLRECARLQGFSDSFVFQSPVVSLVEGYRLVGNAVPPPMSTLFASAVQVALRRLPHSLVASA